PELRDYLAGLGIEKASDADLLAAFRVLPLPRREVFLDRVYLEELKQTGIDYNQVGGPRYQSYNRAFNAIATLFPGFDRASVAPHAGDIILNNKPFETESGGDINLLAPYGRIAVGAE